MLLANIPIADVAWKVPCDILERACFPEIDICSKNVPMGADEWITCSSAWPHLDTHLKEHLLLTLSIVSAHQVGDALSPEPMMDALAGCLFVVDPMTRHWLGPAIPDRSLPNQPWVGIQWHVDHSSTSRRAREIVTRYDSTWLDCSDDRYSGWASQS